MSVLEWRGGFPVVFQGSVAITAIITDSKGNTIASAAQPLVLGAHQVQQGEDGRKSPILSKWLRIANLDTTAANILRIYFTQVNFDNDEHYISLPGGETRLSLWEGPAEVRHVWLRAVAGTPSFDITAFHRRG